ncbi:hypothetical protein PLESTB_001805100 [Pleodorina starrii]|uniref:Uncharacterized protein n=1 Tax=Pleodorina starrii TaxID=330485 RepID=A0A9W6C298_9CHLO|nr:hypothetical protein PLESTM_002093900 [Pleodorina starrii]GLC61806.1 hypothetical protein PLESTB_001805100 [Pleodorina starrii]GLC69852.1 hypothetical protein PLESTF_000887600 [Pleodorina starrii]
MEAEVAEECQGVRRFNPFRSVRRGLTAACRWTIRFGRGRSTAPPGHRAGRRGGRGRRGAPPLASLAAAMLEPEDIMDLDDEPCAPSSSVRLDNQPRVSSRSPLQLISAAVGNSFPLVLRRPVFDAFSESPNLHNPPRRALHYHANADDIDLYNSHHHHHHHGLQQHDDAPWSHHHHHHHHPSRTCSCGGVAAGAGCTADCPATAAAASSKLQHRHHSGGSATCGGSGGGGTAGLQQGQGEFQGQGHSVQHLLAVGSRQWGSGGWWDGRGLLRVKIYDFAIYADPAKAAHALRSAAESSAGGSRIGRQLGCGGDAAASSSGSSSGGGGGGCASDLLVSPSSRVDMSLTIRACRNLPLHMLSQEFERVLQRRHEKAGGRPDDPALQELLSYFSRERLPEHVVVLSPAHNTPASASSSANSASSSDDPTTISSSSSSCSSGGDASVRKGATITFSRSPCGSLVTEAGGRVLGVVHSPALATALFDLYLGDQPVSKRAKAAAGAALLDMAAAGGWGRPAEYRYRPGAGERLVCAPGARGPADVDACCVEVL